MMDDTLRMHSAAPEALTRARPARVLIVTPVGLQGRGGIDRLNLYLFGFLEQRGDAGRIAFIGSRGESEGAGWVFTFVASLFRFAFACLSGRHDVVHIHVSTNGSALRKVAFATLSRLFRMPYIIQFHGMMCPEYEAARPLWFRALGSLARPAQQVIVLGEAYRAPFERMGVKSERLAIVHNGIPDIGADLVLPRKGDGTLNIVFSGEVGERKGANLLVEALTQLPSDVSDWRCTIAGNGELAALQARVAEAGLGDRISFTGWVDIGRVHQLMRSADIVVLPSCAEALPLALIEGASAGAALVACDVGAVADIVADGVNGFIVERNANAIAACLQKLLGDAGLRQGMQLASRQIYRERFQVSHFASAMLGAYEAARKA